MANGAIKPEPTEALLMASIHSSRSVSLSANLIKVIQVSRFLRVVDEQMVANGPTLPCCRIVVDKLDTEARVLNRDQPTVGEKHGSPRNSIILGFEVMQICAGEDEIPFVLKQVVGTVAFCQNASFVNTCYLGSLPILCG